MFKNTILALILFVLAFFEFKGEEIFTYEDSRIDTIAPGGEYAKVVVCTVNPTNDTVYVVINNWTINLMRQKREGNCMSVAIGNPAFESSIGIIDSPSVKVSYWEGIKLFNSCVPVFIPLAPRAKDSIIFHLNGSFRCLPEGSFLFCTILPFLKKDEFNDLVQKLSISPNEFLNHDMIIEVYLDSIGFQMNNKGLSFNDLLNYKIPNFDDSDSSESVSMVEIIGSYFDNNFNIRIPFSYRYKEGLIFTK